MTPLTRPCKLNQTTTTTNRDDMGDLITEPAAGVVTVCELQQDSATELRVGGQIQVTTWTLLLPADTTADGWSEILIAPPGVHSDDWDQLTGDKFALEGEPWRVRHPRTGTIHHVEASLRKVT